MTRADGAGVPRLQELAFLWEAHLAISDGKTFEQIRVALIEHMRSERADDAASGNTARHQLKVARRDRYVSNVTEALKTLMRLALLDRASLPADGKAAGYYRDTTFGMTDAGERWAALLRADRRSALNELLEMLWGAFPQFKGFLRVMARGGLTIPLATWLEFGEPATREGYIARLSAKAAGALGGGEMGWAAPETEIRAYVTEYLEARIRFAVARQRPDPYPRNQDFVRACEEALVKLAFDKAGEPLDYISHEVLRRWMRELQVASFSYHAPGLSALRLWPTADIIEADGGLEIRRHVGDAYREDILRYLGQAYELVRQAERSQTPWVPIYRIRAATCSRLLVSERLFDQTVLEFMSERRGQDLPYRINVDPAQFGTVPPSERPLRVPTKRGPRDVYTLTLVPHVERMPA